MMDVLAEGYLVQQHGIDPSTGEAWQPTWISKCECNEEAIAQWDSRSTAHRQHSVDTLAADVEDDSQNDCLSFCPEPGSNRKRPISDVKEETLLEDNAGQLGLVKRPKYTSLGARPPSYGPLQTRFKSSRKRSSTIRAPSAASGFRSSSDTSTSSTLVTQKEAEAPPTEVTSGWLLCEPLRPEGITVEVRHSFPDDNSPGWGRGEFEGVQGVVQAVLNVHNDTEFSTASVSLRDPLEDAQKVYAVPVKYLWPVSPSEAGQSAIILVGPFCGKLAKLRELEDDVSNWFVSAGNCHFEIEAEHMVRLQETK